MRKLCILRIVEAFFAFMVMVLPPQLHSQPNGSLRLEKFDGGFFSMSKPEGWRVITAGACGNFAFLIQDPSEPLRQIFYFGEVGPVYMSQQQKQIDAQYMNMSGYPIPWIDMPVVSPLTPSNFLAQFHLIAQSQIAQNFMPQCPTLENLQIISAVPQQSPIDCGGTELIRALFTEGGNLGEGLFLVTVAPFMPFMGGPGGSSAYGLLITGITAPKREFRDIENIIYNLCLMMAMTFGWKNLLMDIHIFDSHAFAPFLCSRGTAFRVKLDELAKFRCHFPFIHSGRLLPSQRVFNRLVPRGAYRTKGG